jgi:succinate-semialdehyde dehydrogenase / glutarate-semialdehyde dehydrogenase
MISDVWLRDACYIDGQWIGADDGQTIAVTNPATGTALATVPRAGRAETARAIAAAALAFPAWRARLAKERAELMFAMHDALLAEKQALGELLTREQGKSRAEAEGEIAGGAAFFRWFGEEAKRVYGDTIPSPWPGKRILVTKEPVGVVGAITPWNFPHSMIARKLAAALGAGCTMVIKPASQTPLSALAVAAICEKVGLPAGVMNVVTGSAAPIAAEMCENPIVRKITFTGSTEVGKDLGARALAHMKRVSMELGGNAPFIVFDDADLDAAVKAAVLSKFRNSGQTCVCTNRFLVQAGVYDAFAAKLAAAVRELKVGNGLDTGVEQGPLIDKAAVEKVEEHIGDAREHGARVLAGGVRHALGGTFFEPTVLADVTSAMKIAREETFGPVAPLFRFETEADAIRMANDTEYGLACYVFTRDLGRSWRMMEALEYGMVGINEGLASSEAAPFGGVKDSGLGREGSKYGLDDYLNIKYALFGGLGV